MKRNCNKNKKSVRRATSSGPLHSVRAVRPAARPATDSYRDTYSYVVAEAFWQLQHTLTHTLTQSDCFWDPTTRDNCQKLSLSLVFLLRLLANVGAEAKRSCNMLNYAQKLAQTEVSFQAKTFEKGQARR